MPTAKIISSVEVNTKPNFKIFNKLAPNITGIARKKVNSVATILLVPTSIPPKIVAPERLVPGITAKTWEVSVANIEGSSKLTTNSSNFGKVTVKDGDSAKYKITAKATYDAGAMPVTNLGNDCPSKQIAAGSKSKTSSGLTGYRAWFHCYRPGGSLIDINSITSDTIRNNIGSDTKTKWVSKNGSFTSSLATTNMQQIFFAAPAGVVKSVAVAHSVNGAPQTVLTKTIYVKGASNYVTSDAPNGMAYDLFYVSNDNPNDGSATYTITVTKN